MSTITTRFVTAGRAIFTVSNPKGERYTFRITKKEHEPESVLAHGRRDPDLLRVDAHG
jgi:hypothetical protein